MEPRFIFLPVILQVLLTLYGFILLKAVKGAALARGEVDLERRGVHGDAWPDQVVTVNNHITNQFQVPVLFYVLISALWALGAVDMAAHIVAWLFVVARLGHAYVHLGTNHVPARLKFFSASVVAVFVLAALVARAVVLPPV